MSDRAAAPRAASESGEPTGLAARQSTPPGSGPWGVVLGAGAAVIGIALLSVAVSRLNRAQYATFEVSDRAWKREIKVERATCPPSLSAAACTAAPKKWTSVRTLVASGTTPEETPYWPDVQLARQGECDGCERPGEHRETYTVRFMRGAQVAATCEFPFQRWADFMPGSKWVASKNDEGALDCSALQRK